MSDDAMAVETARIDERPRRGDALARAGAITARHKVVVLWVGVSVYSAAWAWNRARPSGISWHFFLDGAHRLFGADGLHVYAHDPQLQIGPLAFLVTRLLLALPASWVRPVAEGLMTAAGVLVLMLLAPVVAPQRRLVRLALVAVVMMPAWTVLAVRWAHLDDVLATVFAVAAVRAVARHRPVLAGLGLAAAIAAKPWAIGFTPIVVALDGGAVTAAVVVAAGVALAWSPFVVADSATLRALHPDVQVTDDSGLRLFGYDGAIVPRWVRTGQFLLAPAAALIAVLRGRWAGALLVALAVRLLLDPQDLGYYAASAVVAAAVFDLLATRSTIPWTALVTAIVLWQPFVPDYNNRFALAHGIGLWWFRHPRAVGWIHSAWSIGVVALVLAWPRRGRFEGAPFHRVPAVARSRLLGR